jgi:hypothetical protein
MRSIVRFSFRQCSPHNFKPGSVQAPLAWRSHLISKRKVRCRTMRFYAVTVFAMFKQDQDQAIHVQSSNKASVVLSPVMVCPFLD